ncbi:hypothetical protein GCM10010106_15120 [Thermopolyspora flexuosa]|jgi:hypothetical protein|uniref:Uncharacterized protein n=1 Tax=Thermopolyspora flexuosa TaxID=103836 RepID=A0A543IPL2_9ACTN|nr:hypothetical protein [Thermopolyspora flexuosa]TQM72522.1 hypothetical protein FHX40_4668 [Thermopolyspora flexuosa]GGM69880.1 hypothetical protein GCM10010106_15120 [Thermopolyspora flexuosa]
MDPIVPTLAAILTALVGGAAGEAGKSAWESLAALVRRRFGRDRQALEAVARPDAVAPGELASLLGERAAADPEFRAALERWLAEAGPVARRAAGDPVNDTVNIVSGHVGGNVIQAREIHGSITFGGDPRR